MNDMTRREATTAAPVGSTTEQATSPRLSPIVHADPTDVNPVPVVLDPEHALVGVLLQCDDVDATASLLALVADEDLADPQARAVVKLARALVDDLGTAPTPVAILGHARTTGAVTGEHATQQFSHYIVDTFRGSPGPAAGRYLAGVVLEGAYRRAATEYATRVIQAADDSPLEVFEQVLADRERLRDLWRRHRLAEGTPAVQEVGVA